MNLDTLDSLVAELGDAFVSQLPGNAKASSRVIRSGDGLTIQTHILAELTDTDQLVLTPQRLVRESSEEVVRAIITEHFRPLVDRVNRATAGAVTAWDLGRGVR